MSNIDAERGKLLGSRIAVFNELNPGEKLKTNEVQLLSGGDGISATPKYKDPLTIIPRHLCILATNHMPELSQVIPAMVERLICINFPVTFTDLLPGEQPTQHRRQADKGLKAYLDLHKGEVLTWLVKGAKMWYDSPHLKRDAPAKVVEASTKYFLEQDKIARFLHEVCVLGEERKVATSVLLATYNDWNNGEKSIGSKEMASLLKGKGFEKKPSKIDGITVNAFIGVDVRLVIEEDE